MILGTRTPSVFLFSVGPRQLSGAADKAKRLVDHGYSRLSAVKENWSSKQSTIDMVWHWGKKLWRMMWCRGWNAKSGILAKVAPQGSYAVAQFRLAFASDVLAEKACTVSVWCFCSNVAAIILALDKAPWRCQRLASAMAEDSITLRSNRIAKLMVEK